MLHPPTTPKAAGPPWKAHSYRHTGRLCIVRALDNIHVPYWKQMSLGVARTYAPASRLD